MKRFLYLALIVPALLLGVSACDDDDETVAVWVPNRVEVPAWSAGQQWTSNPEYAQLYNSLKDATANKSVTPLGTLVCDDHYAADGTVVEQRWYFHKTSNAASIFAVNGEYYTADYEGQIWVGFAACFPIKASYDAIMGQYQKDTKFSTKSLLLPVTGISFADDSYNGLPIIGFDSFSAPNLGIEEPLFSMALKNDNDEFPIYAIEDIDTSSLHFFPTIYAAIDYMFGQFIAKYGNEVEISGTKYDIAALRATYQQSMPK